MKKILQKEASILRKVAQEVPVNTVTSAKIKNILKEMMVALDSQDDGVAIAAPQIGYSLRIFLVSGKVESIEKMKDGPADETNELESKARSHQVFINPVIKKISKKKNLVEEGCLSVRYLYGKVERADKVSVEAFNENGKKFSRGAKGLMAQIFQHEIDHLDGVLFIDKATKLEEIIPAHLTASKTKNAAR